MRKIIKLLIIFLLSFSFILILLLFFIQPLNSIKDVNKNPEIIIVNENDDILINLINNHPITAINLDEFNQSHIDILLHIEDKTFYKHSGFNIQRIFKTLYSNIANNQSYGASTITQQYIKNIYLDNSKTFTRKIKELYYAIKLEQLASKDEILTGYLNCIYLGNDIYGIANATKYYFNKDYQNISTKDMICIIALLNSPSYYSNNIEKWNIKKNQIAQILYEDNLIDYETYSLCLSPITLNINENLYSSPLRYYTDAVIQEFKGLNITAKFNQVIKIKTKYNQEINNISINTNGNFSSLAIDKNGYILSCIGDVNYKESTYNIALNGKRDIGSTIKPILYYEALKCGYTINSTHISAPFSFTYNKDTITIKNYASNYPNKAINMKTALATSDNIYAIKTHLDIGMRTLVNHLKKYNISAEAIPSLALGSVGMSLYDLTRIYSQFFTEGEYLSLKFISEIKINDKIIYQAKKSSKTLGNSKYFKEIKSIMDGLFDSNIPNSTASSIGSLLKYKCYGKSGLTDYDSYMIGFSDDILVAVWSGHLDNSLLLDSNIKRLPKTIFIKQINSFKNAPTSSA